MHCESNYFQGKFPIRFSYQVFTKLQYSHILTAVCTKYAKRETVYGTELPEALTTFSKWTLDVIPHSISKRVEGTCLPVSARVGSSLAAGSGRGFPRRGAGLGLAARASPTAPGRREAGAAPGHLEPPGNGPRLGQEVSRQVWARAWVWARLRGHG